MRFKVDLKKAIKYILKKGSTPPDNQKGVDPTFSEYWDRSESELRIISDKIPETYVTLKNKR